MREELKSLQTRLGISFIHVTHSQDEAMALADLVVVMNGGKIEQAGSPEEIYDRPRSEFVARFIGSSNVVKGKGLDGGRIELAGIALQCSGEPVVPGAPTAVSIRPHGITLTAAPPQNADNVLPATVVRQVFLGDSRDYMVELKDGTQLRTVTAPADNIPHGSAVWLHLPAERCRALAG